MKASRTLALSLTMSLALTGCSESRDEPIVDLDAPSDVVIDAAVTDTARPDTAVTDTARADTATPDAATPDVAGARLVINEISAVGDEWVELYNAGSSTVDLSNVQVADSETDGGPRASRAMRFPSGTMLSPGQYVLVLANQSDAGVGPQTRCLDGGPTTCFHASWSLSASRGETVWVLASTGDVTLQELYPMNAAMDGQSWGRLPNGTGAFAVNRPTPGAVNAGL